MDKCGGLLGVLITFAFAVLIGAITAAAVVLWLNREST